MLPLDCAHFFSFSFILSKSRCPVLTAGLRIYLTKENGMFNNKKAQKRQKMEENVEKEKEGFWEKNCNLYFKTACTRLRKSYLE